MHLQDLLLLLPLAATPVLSAAMQPMPPMQPILHPRANVQDQFAGRGRILAVNPNNTLAKDTDTVIGCLDTAGNLVNEDSDDCGFFTVRSGEFPTKIFSDSGVCTFLDQDQPCNLDNYYGRDSYAWKCGPGKNTKSWFGDEHYYTVNGFPVPLVCTANLVCKYETKNPPTTPGAKFKHPVWVMAWGAHQMDITGGHVSFEMRFVPNEDEA